MLDPSNLSRPRRNLAQPYGRRILGAPPTNGTGVAVNRHSNVPRTEAERQAQRAPVVDQSFRRPHFL